MASKVIELEAEIIRLQAELDDANEKLADTQAAIQQVAQAGYMVSAPNRDYNGRLAGFEFRSGRVFVPDTDANREKVMALANDFGYEVVKMDAAEFQQAQGNLPEPVEGERAKAEKYVRAV